MPLDQRVSAPYGDVYTFATPKTDRFIANHEAQERQDELYRQKEVDDMDKQLSSHLGNVLNGDIPEIIQNWQNYKQSKKQQLFDPKIQKDPNLYAQKQIEVNQNLAKVMGAIGDSSDRKKNLAQQLQEYNKTPYKMVDNFYDQYNHNLNVPTSFASKFPGHDDMHDQGPSLDFTKSVNDAKGKPRVFATTYKDVGDNGEQRIPTTWTGTNAPDEFQTALNNKLGDQNYRKSAAKAFKNMDPALVQQINEHYAALPKEHFDKWGKGEKPNLDAADPTDPAQLFNSLQAKTYAINHEFTQKDGRPERNAEVARNLNWQQKVALVGLHGKQWQSQEAVRQNNRIQLKSMSSGKAGGSEDDNLLVSAAPQVFKNGTPAAVNYLLGNFATGGAKGVDGIKVGLEPPVPTSDKPFPAMGDKPVPTVKYVKNTFVYDKGDKGEDLSTGHFEQIPHVIQFDPNSPNLQEQVVKALNEVKGKDLKLTRKVYNMDKATGKATDVTDAPVKPAKTPKVKKEESAEEIMKRLGINF